MSETVKKPQTFEEITPEQVAEWKAKHNNVYLIAVKVNDDPDDTNEARFYAKTPSVKQMRTIAEIATDKKGGQMLANDTMRATVILGGDMKYLDADCDDAGVYLAVMEQIGELVGQKKASSRKV